MSANPDGMRSAVNNDTICSIATPSVGGALGVIRISGPDSLAVLSKLWRGRVSPSAFEPRKLYLGEVSFRDHAPAGRVDRFSDRVMAVFMPAPNTYTGDDVVEISCHGSKVIMARLIDACVTAGARVAGPGEFTRRAFLAGKMDLAQAEAVCDLISADSERAARLAKSQLDGKLSAEIRSICDEIAETRAVVEAHIDFPDEEIGRPDNLGEMVSKIVCRLLTLTTSFDRGRLVREGARIAIVGRPNAGKSSVLNRLAGQSRAIVHHEPGTTRDVVEEQVVIEGAVFRLRDTAGVRNAPTDVESLGIERTHEEISGADLALVVFDGSSKFSEDDERVLNLVKDTRAIYIVNKSDLLQNFDVKRLDSKPLKISALTGSGFDLLEQRLSSFIDDDHTGSTSREGITLTSGRHKAVVDNAISELNAAKKLIDRSDGLDLTARHLMGAHEALGSITGEAVSEEVLDRIFSKFCIGK